MFYQRKPFIVEAHQFDGTTTSATKIIDWVLANGGTATYHCESPENCTADFHIVKLRVALGMVSVRRTYWVVKRSRDFTICNPDLFSANYEPASEVSNERAIGWDEGFATGKSRAMRHMSDEPGLSLDVPNPYRKGE